VAQANRFTAIILCAIAGVLLSAAPASAQYSPGYKFLEAVKKKDGDAVTLALKSPGSTIINSRDITTGETALHIVTQRRDLVWMQFLLAQGANPNIADTKGVTPLVLATQLGFLEGAETLIGKGARIDVPNATGETPLIAAVHRHDIPMLRLLLKSGADPDRADSSGRSARDYAKLGGGNLISEIEKNERSAALREGAKTYGPSY